MALERRVNRVITVRLDHADRPGTPVRIRVPRKSHPFTAEMPLTMGSDWFTLRGTAIDRLLNPVHAPVLRYFQPTFLPSEGYIHTVLLSNTLLVNLPVPTHYFRFEGAHPAELDRADLQAARESGCWFARKLIDPALLDELDDVLLNGANPS